MAMYYAEAQYQEFALLGGQEVDMNRLVAKDAAKRDLRVRWTVRWMEIPSSDIVKIKSGVEKDMATAKKKAKAWKIKNNPEKKRGIFSWL